MLEDLNKNFEDLSRFSKRSFRIVKDSSKIFIRDVSQQGKKYRKRSPHRHLFFVVLVATLEI